MSSTSETQQPSFHVRAQAAGSISTSAAPNQQSFSSVQTGSLSESGDSFNRWTQTQLKLGEEERARASAQGVPEQPNSTSLNGDGLEEGAVRNEAAHIPQKSVLARWKVVSSPDPSRKAPAPSDPITEVDELDSSSAPKGSDSAQDGPHVPTPPDSQPKLSPKQGEKTKSQSPAHDNVNSALVSKSAGPSRTRTPQKPLSALKPRLPVSTSHKQSITSPTFRLSSPKSPVKPVPTPNNHRPSSRSTRYRVSNDNDDESFASGLQLSPRRRLQRIFEDVRQPPRRRMRQEELSESDEERDIKAQDNEDESSGPRPAGLEVDVENNQLGDDVGFGRAVGRAGHEPPEIGEPSTRTSPRKAPPLVASSSGSSLAPMGDPHDHSAAALLLSLRTSPDAGAQRRLVDNAPSSRKTPDPSQLFSSPVQPLSVESPPKTPIRLVATQAVPVDKPDSATKASPPPNKSPAKSIQVLKGPKAPTEPSDGTPRTSIPNHRRLGRVNPRQAPLNGPAKAPNAHIPISLPPDRPPNLVSPIDAPKTDPLHGMTSTNLEPTQIDDVVRNSIQPKPRGPNGPVSSGALQDTYVDAAPLSPPPEDIADPPISLAGKKSERQISVPTAELQPTYIDSRSISILPAAPPIPVAKKYRRGKAKNLVVTEEGHRDEVHASADGHTSTQRDAEAGPSAAARPASPVNASKSRRRGRSRSIQAADNPESVRISPKKARRISKRKPSHDSIFTTGRDDDSDSSPAPEDTEDYTYRPVPKGKGVRGKSHQRATTAPANTDLKRKGRNVSARPSVTSASSKPPSKRPPSPFDNDKPATHKKQRISPRAKQRASSISSLSTPSAHISPPFLPHPPRHFDFRVLGWWQQLKAYFPGTVTERIGDKFHVDFDDSTSKDLAIDRLRRLELRKGEIVRGNEELFGKGILEVEEDVSGAAEHVRLKQDGETIGLVSIVEISVADSFIKKHFNDRMVKLEDLGIDPTRGVDSLSPSKARSGKVFSGKCFLITSNGSDAPPKDQESLSDTIRRHGGKVLDDWPRLFDLPNDHFGSNLNSGLPAPFLLAVGGEGMKPKIIAALASGIPYLSSKYVADAIIKVRPFIFSLTFD